MLGKLIENKILCNCEQLYLCQMMYGVYLTHILMIRDVIAEDMCEFPLQDCCNYAFWSRLFQSIFYLSN